MDQGNKLLNKKFFTLLIVVATLIVVGVLGANLYKKFLITSRKQVVFEKLELYKHNIEIALSRRESLLSGLEKFVNSRSGKEIERDFQIFASGLHNDFEGVRNVGIAPNGVLRFIYPLEGNEGALGYNLFEDTTPSVRSDISRMIESRNMVMSNPFELLQGGIGLAARKAIYKEDRLWGLVSVVIDVPTLIEYSGLNSVNNDLELALRDKDGNVFWGKSEVMDKEPVIQRVENGDGYWELVGVYVDGWWGPNEDSLNSFILIFLLIGSLITLAFWNFLNKDYSLLSLDGNSTEGAGGLKAAVIYFVISLIWIFYSDRLIQSIFVNPKIITEIQTVKGFAFVGVSACILYWLVERNYRKYLVSNSALDSIVSGSHLLNTAESKKDLFQGLSDELVERAGYDMAWVGVVEEGLNKEIKAVGMSGGTDGFFDEVNFSSAKGLEGGPEGLAVRIKKNVVMNDISSVTVFPEWRLAVEKRNLNSAMAIPIMDKNLCIGLISIYSKKKNAFSYGDLNLLSTFAGEVMSGIKKIEHNIDLSESRKKLESTLLLLRNVQAVAKLGYYTLDIKTGIWEPSNILKQLFGINGKYITDVTGWLKLIHPDDREEMEKYFSEEVLKKKKVFDKEYKIVNKLNGKEIWVHGLGRLEFDSKGSPVRMIGTIQDITERKMFEASLADKNMEIFTEKQKLEVVLRDMGDAVLVTDAKKHALMINRAMEKLLGISQEKGIGQNIQRLLSIDYKKSKIHQSELYEKVFELRQPISPVESLIISKKGGKKIVIQIVANPLIGAQGELVGTVWVFRDISKEHRLEKMRLDLVSLASHQLRSPLTGIKWFVELLLEGRDKITSSKAKEYIEKIGKSNDNLIELVNDLLTTSRIDSGTLDDKNIEKVEVRDLLQEAALREEKLLMDKNISLVGLEKISEKLTVEVDRVQMIQVFSNLLDNAINYSPKNSKVYVKAENVNGSVEISVRDTGLGIPNDQQKKIYEKFFRADNVAKIISGTGLGLYMTKNIVTNHGGTIRFKSKENKGTTFFVKLLIKQKKDG